LGRFTLNSTVGLAGFIDVAKEKPFNSPRRPNGFANTLGFYGVKPGPYFYLPLIGSTTVRDLFGGTVDGLLYPTVIGKPFTQLEFTIPAGTLSALDYRIENDEKIRSVNEDSADPYTATREQYLARRQAEIDALRGKVAPPQDTVPTTSSEQTPAADPELQH
jgi:phospholipid-binding lipoprotein MlaA